MLCLVEDYSRHISVKHCLNVEVTSVLLLFFEMELLPKCLETRIRNLGIKSVPLSIYLQIMSLYAIMPSIYQTSFRAFELKGYT